MNTIEEQEKLIKILDEDRRVKEAIEQELNEKQMKIHLQKQNISDFCSRASNASKTNTVSRFSNAQS